MRNVTKVFYQNQIKIEFKPQIDIHQRKTGSLTNYKEVNIYYYRQVSNSLIVFKLVIFDPN